MNLAEGLLEEVEVVEGVAVSSLHHCYWILVAAGLELVLWMWRKELEAEVEAVVVVVEDP